jgi:hypothetical protein
VLHGVVPPLSRCEFHTLTHDLRTSQHWIATAVIEMQMTVHHHLDLVQRNADGAKRLR